MPERPQDVTELSDSSEAEPSVCQKRGLKRKRGKSGVSRKKFPLDDDIGIQLLVGKKCLGRCKKRCKQTFQSRDAYQELKAFRKTWQGYHKTDQDQIVAKICFQDGQKMFGVFQHFVISSVATVCSKVHVYFVY